MRRKLLNSKMMVVLAICLILFMVVGVAEEERIDASGQWKYALEEVGATITGYVEEPRGDLVIPSELDGYPVTGIGYNVFDYCEEITGVAIPDSVASIGDYAFSRCVALMHVIIPDSVSHIGFAAFTGCESLTEVIIPTGLESIEEAAFSWCGGLTSVAIPNSVISIGTDAFSYCYSLTGVTIGV